MCAAKRIITEGENVSFMASAGPKKLKVNTEGGNSCLRLRKLEKSFEDVPLLDEESNDYNLIINFEIIYHVTWVRLIKSTLFVETAVIKNTDIHQKIHKNCQKVKDVENMILT